MKKNKYKYWYLFGSLTLIGLIISVFYLKEKKTNEIEDDLEAMLDSVDNNQ